MDLENNFNVGSLVVFKTHPLLNSFRIKGDGKYVPPILMVKEVYVENYKKKTNDEETGRLIADRIKYICVYFDDNKSVFKEIHMYESMLVSFEKLKIERITKHGEIRDESESIIEEIKSFKPPKYKFGGVVRFKTKKIEIYKKRSSKKIPLKEGIVVEKKIKEIVQYVVNYTTPDFVICGFKINDTKDLYYPNGNIKRLVAQNLLKVKWYNPSQQKFSEEYLPEVFFTDKMKFIDTEHD